MPDDVPSTPGPPEPRPDGSPPGPVAGRPTDPAPGSGRAAAPDREPPPDSGTGTGGRDGRGRYLPLRDRDFTSTYIVAPVVVLVLGIGIVAAFSWIGERFDDEKPPLYVSGSHSPRNAVTTRPGTPQPSASRETPAAPDAPSRSASAERVDQSEAAEEGVQQFRGVYLCPWAAWVVARPPEDFSGAPGLEDGSPDPEVINADTAGDPGVTHFVIDVQPVDDRPVQIKGLRIKVLERNPAPAADEATLVGLQTGGCGAPEKADARADLDGGADFATVRFEGEGLPRELTGGKSLSIGVTVETRTCDCRWVPEIVWAKDGEVKETEFRIDGEDFRTIATDGLPRRAWKQDLNTRVWTGTAFDESVLGRREP
ncbi:hypothetical protein JNUCC64_11685 [Streptomyces sp. JNUCC 64]